MMMSTTSARTAMLDEAQSQPAPPAAATPAAAPARPRVVIVGAGFGGLSAAKALAKAPVEVTLVDRRNYHLFQPLLYQVATAGLSAPAVSAPIRHVLRREMRRGNLTVLQAEVIGFDVAARRVLLDAGQSLTYDHLIVAAGATHSYFGHDEWAAHAATSWQPRLCATSRAGASRASSTSSRRAIQSPRSGHIQSFWTTRASPYSASQRLCQCAGPESCQPGKVRNRAFGATARVGSGRCIGLCFAKVSPHSAAPTRPARVRPWSPAR